MANVDVFRQNFNVLGVAVSPSPATGFMFSLATIALPTSGVNQLTYIPRVQSASTGLVEGSIVASGPSKVNEAPAASTTAALLMTCS